jgi:hypothetical protein
MIYNLSCIQQGIKHTGRNSEIMQQYLARKYFTRQDFSFNIPWEWLTQRFCFTLQHLLRFWQYSGLSVKHENINVYTENTLR